MTNLRHSVFVKLLILFIVITLPILIIGITAIALSSKKLEKEIYQSVQASTNSFAAALDEEGRRRFRAEKIGLVFQQFHLIPFLTALENIMLAQHYHSVVDEAAARKVLEQVGLGHRVTHLPSQLSGGEQQRVCIARALVNEPPVIFADEPTGNLDEENEQRVLDLLTDLHRQGRTIVMVTHNPALGQFADRILRLQHGKYLGEEANQHALA